MNDQGQSSVQSRSQLPQGGRRSVCSRPPSNLNSDYPTEQEEGSPTIGQQRSISLVSYSDLSSLNLLNFK